MSLLTPPTASFSAGTGTIITAGRCTAAARAEVNSALLTGFGEVMFTGPVTSARSSRNRAAATQSDSPIQLITWRPDPSRAPRPSRNSGSSRPSTPPWRDSTIPDAQRDHPDARGGGLPGGRFPVPYHFREEATRLPGPTRSPPGRRCPRTSRWQNRHSNTPGGAAIAASALTSARVP